MEELIKIAKKHGLTRDDLLSEADTVEECGEWLYMCLLGYSPEELREAAEQM